jgi:hypothetical protein
VDDAQTIEFCGQPSERDFLLGEFNLHRLIEWHVTTSIGGSARCSCCFAHRWRR